MRISDWSSDVCSSDLPVDYPAAPVTIGARHTVIPEHRRPNAGTQDSTMQAPITSKGAQRLRAELDELKSTKRPAVIHAIAEARAHGDLKENAEYHAAREQHSFIEARIQLTEAELSHPPVLHLSSLNARSSIDFGATVDMAHTTPAADPHYPNEPPHHAHLTKPQTP